MSKSIKPPKWFLIVAILAFIWNLIGLWGFSVSVNLGPEQLDEIPERMKGYYEEGVPWYYWASYGLAVISGVIGCVLLLMKKKWATLVFTLSIVGVLIFNSWAILVSNMSESMILEDYIIQTLVLVVAILLLFLSKRAEREGWIS